MSFSESLDTIGWLPPAAIQLVRHSRTEAEALADGDGQSDEIQFVEAQNEAMLIKFFEEQFDGPSPIGPLTTRIIERDFGSHDQLQEKWLRLARSEDVSWIILGLSFYDFRFHFLPVRLSIPFCASPALCWCFTHSVIRESNLMRDEFAIKQWNATDWRLCEARISCLEQPLDIFEEPKNCAAPSCLPSESNVSAQNEKSIA